MYPSLPRIELFARARRPGWEPWGAEVDKFTAGDDEVVERIAEQIGEQHADEENVDALDYLACRAESAATA
jgi:hypothetical protein